jgi:hypothetical protein
VLLLLLLAHLAHAWLLQPLGCGNLAAQREMLLMLLLLLAAQVSPVLV